MDTRWMLGLLVIGALLSGCAGKSEDFETVEAPELKSGYAWAYDVEGFGKAEATVKVDGEVVESDIEEEPFGPATALVYEILGTGFRADNESIAIGAAVGGDLMELVFETGTGSPSGKHLIALRERDLSEIKADLLVQEKCVQQACTQEAYGIMIENEAWMDPYLDFPLTPGKKWSQTVANEAADPGMAGNTMDIVSEAVRMEKVGLPNGTVQAILVVHAITLPEVEEMVRQAREGLEQSGLEDGKLDVRIDAAMTTWYAPEAKAVAKEALRLTVDIRMSFKQDGHTYDLKAIAELDVTRKLSGISLVAEPPRDEAGLLEFFNSGEPVNDPSGSVSVPSGEYTLTLEGDRDVVNAADQEVVRFFVNATPSMPEDHTVIYTVTGPEGKVVATGEGPTLDFTPPGPGVFSVLAQAVDADRILQAHASDAVVADYRITQDLACGIVTLDHQFCDALDVPMAFGIRSATFRVDGASSAGIVPTIGTLILEDSEGSMDEATAGPGDEGTVELTLDSFKGRPLGTTWQLYWDPEVEAMTEGTITIDLDYSGTAVEEVTVEPMWMSLLRDALGTQGLDMFEAVLMPSS